MPESVDVALRVVAVGVALSLYVLLVLLQLLGRVGDVDVEGTAGHVLPRPLDVDDVVAGLRRVVATVDGAILLALTLHLDAKRAFEKVK